MPRYFIDLHDGSEPVRDTVGCELPDLVAARAQAVRILTRVTQGFRDEPGRQDYVAAVRDARGAIRLRLRVSLDAGPVDHADCTSHTNGAAEPPSIWASKPLKLRCFLVSTDRQRGSAPVYAVLANAAEEALAAVAHEVALRSKPAIIGGLSKDTVRRLGLEPGELRLV